MEVDGMEQIFTIFAENSTETEQKSGRVFHNTLQNTGKGAHT